MGFYLKNSAGCSLYRKTFFPLVFFSCVLLWLLVIPFRVFFFFFRLLCVAIHWF